MFIDVYGTPLDELMAEMSALWNEHLGRVTAREQREHSEHIDLGGEA